MVTTVQFSILRQFMWLNNRSGIETKILNKQNIDLELQLQTDYSTTCVKTLGVPKTMNNTSAIYYRGKVVLQKWV